MQTRREARELRRFRTRLAHDPAAPVLLLSPHWDDAVFGCWSLLTAGVDLVVVNVFGRIPDRGPARRWDVLTGARDGAERARERIAEDREALAAAGREPRDLPLLDAEYREPGPAPGLVEMDLALASAVPAASAVFAPATLGLNVDHRLVRQYARALHLRGMPVRLYADAPYCITHGWPSWVDDLPPDPLRDVDYYWGTYLTAVPELADVSRGVAVRLGPKAAAAKLAAMRAYRTQFPALDGGPTRLLSNPEIHGIEVYWALGDDPSAVPEVRG